VTPSAPSECAWSFTTDCEATSALYSLCAADGNVRRLSRADEREGVRADSHDKNSGVPGA